MVIAVDTKNLALYTGGIAGFIRPLVHAWVRLRPDIQFVLIGPPWDSCSLTRLPNCEHYIVDWPEALPRPFRHPFYDNVLFPRAIRRTQPDCIFTPYHDVRLPRGIPSVMMIHDTCLVDMGFLYPWQVRTYYQAMLRVNLPRVRHVLTVSNASRACILARYGLDGQDVSVVPNTLDPEFLFHTDDHEHVAEIRAQWPGGIRLLYPSGAEFRKNVKRLLAALQSLVSRGFEPCLYITGLRDDAWEGTLRSVSSELLTRIHFLGKLSVPELRQHYLAADAIVYPSLCEGFGRVCLEAMELGVPIACSDLPVLREVAGDYPIYFAPLNIEHMAEQILACVKSGRQQPRHETRFHQATVTQLFVETMGKVFPVG